MKNPANTLVVAVISGLLVFGCSDGADDDTGIASGNTIEEGIEILTGMEAGKQRADGSWEPDSIYGKVDATLSRYAEAMKAFAGHGDGHPA